MKKKIFLGLHNQGKCYVEICLHDGRLSITVEEWKTNMRDIRMGGQCLDTLLTYFPNNEKLQRIVAVWERWHLNDMQAGSPAQREWLRNHPITSTDHYATACRELAGAGLNPDPNFIHGGKPYAYGSAWLKEDLSPEIVQEVESW